jgi:hypothetical protein
MEEVIAETTRLDEAKEALAQRLADVRASGYVGLKFRGRLPIRVRPGLDRDALATDSLRKAREIVDAGRPYRLTDKPLLEGLFDRGV